MEEKLREEFITDTMAWIKRNKSWNQMTELEFAGTNIISQ